MDAVFSAGKWLVSNVEDFKGRPTGKHFILCPFCGEEEIISSGRAPFNYCPNCGTDMREHSKGGNMRRKDIIRLFCERLATAWERCPDMRFGQFICNAYSIGLKRDPFYIDDEESIRLIEKFADECSPYHKPKDGVE